MSCSKCGSPSLCACAFHGIKASVKLPSSVLASEALQKFFGEVQAKHGERWRANMFYSWINLNISEETMEALWAAYCSLNPEAKLGREQL